jgi:RNA polymerase sigma-70 factor, ECF subfamily
VGEEAERAGSDVALVTRVARGDAAAFSALYDRYAREVYVLAAHLLGKSDAEEVVQDVFLRLWKYADRFDRERGSFRAWFMTIARHRLLDELRRRRRVAVAAGTIDDLLANAADPDVDLEEGAWRHDRRHVVLEAMKALPAVQRRALVLAYFGGLSQASIAAELGWPLGTVKTRLRLGLQKLRASLTRHAGVENRERQRASG